MIKIFFKKEDFITSVVVEGHAMFSDYGTDIVCASVSSMTILAFNTCIEFDSSVEYEVDEEVGYLKLTVKNFKDNLDTVLKVFYSMIKDLESQYPGHINVIDGGESYD